jgi:hypothetical protein
MPRVSIVTGKSPHHESALRLKDFTPGRHVIRYSYLDSSQYEHIVLDYPFVKHRWFFPGGSAIVIPFRNVQLGTRHDYHASEIGVIPNEHGRWDDPNFVIDYRKRHLIPDVDLTLYNAKRLHIWGYESEELEKFWEQAS